MSAIDVVLGSRVEVSRINCSICTESVSSAARPPRRLPEQVIGTDCYRGRSGAWISSAACSGCGSNTVTTTEQMARCGCEVDDQRRWFRSKDRPLSSEYGEAVEAAVPSSRTCEAIARLAGFYGTSLGRRGSIGSGLELPSHARRPSTILDMGALDGAVSAHFLTFETQR